jgi:hypothetical protein
MTTLLEILYYGDQSVEPLDSIEELVAESQNSVLLTEFLCSAHKKLTLHISKFPHNERTLFKETSFGAIAQSIRKSRAHHVATSTVLSCVAQLGWTIL